MLTERTFNKILGKVDEEAKEQASWVIDVNKKFSEKERGLIISMFSAGYRRALCLARDEREV